MATARCVAGGVKTGGVNGATGAVNVALDVLDVVVKKTGGAKGTAGVVGAGGKTAGRLGGVSGDDGAAAPVDAGADGKIGGDKVCALADVPPTISKARLLAAQIRHVRKNGR